MKNIITLLLILLLGAGGFWLYKSMSKHEKLDLWQLVPDDAIVVVESNDAASEWEKLQQSAILRFLLTFDFFDEPARECSALADIAKRQKTNAFDLFKEHNVLISLHIDRQEQPGMIFYYPLEGIEKDKIKSITAAYKKNSAYVITEVSYEKETYYRLKNKNSESVLNFYKTKKVFIASFSDNLLRHAIDRYMHQSDPTLITRQKELHEATEVVKDNVRMYVNYRQLPTLLQTYTDSSSVKLLPALQSFSDHAFLGVSIKDDLLKVSGYSHNAEDEFNFLKCFDGQRPEEFDLAEYLPQRTISLSYFGVSDVEKLKSNLAKYWWAKELPYAEEWENIKKNSSFDMNEIMNLLGGEIGYALLDNESETYDKVLYLHVKDPENARSTFDKLSLSKIDTLQPAFREKHEGYEIRSLGLSDFPTLVLGEYFDGFGSGYYAQVDDYILVANSSNGLKSALSDIKKGTVWSNEDVTTFDKRQFFSASNVGFHLNSNRVMHALLPVMNAKGRDFHVNYGTRLNQIELFSIQLTGERTKYKTQFVLKVKKDDPEAEVSTNEDVPNIVEQAPEPVTNNDLPPALTKLFESNLPANLIGKPHWITNYADKTRSLIVQDQNNVVYNVSNSGTINWQYQVEGNIVGEVHQVDFFHNSKLQILFATDEKIYSIDSKGKNVEGFPISVPNSEKVISTLSLFDYENSKNYRILVTNESGDMYLYDSKGKSLDGWKPNSIGGAVTSAPRHIRVGTTDIIMAVQKSGKIHAFQRKGTAQAGFPIDVKESIVSDIAFSSAKNLSEATVSVLTASGTIVTFNLEGKEVSRKKVSSQYPGATYTQLIVGTDPTHALLTTNLPQETILLQPNLNEIGKLNKRMATSRQKQLFMFNNTDVLTYINTTANVAEFSDLTGKWLYGGSISTDHQVALDWQKNNTYIAAIWGKKITVYSENKN